MKQSPLLYIACDPPARVWGGVGDLDIPPDTVETETARYLGGGALLNMPDVEMGENAQAVRLDITVSGVNAKTLAVFRDESMTLKGSLAYIGLATFDDDWQLEEVEWITVLTVGAPSFSSQGSSNGRTRSISISLGDWTDRNFPPLALWTQQDQERRSPGDTIFDHVSGLTTEQSRQFGPSDAS